MKNKTLFGSRLWRPEGPRQKVASGEGLLAVRQPGASHGRRVAHKKQSQNGFDNRSTPKMTH
jgi:hypothetical protein